jgi:hypothetical protein
MTDEELIARLRVYGNTTNRMTAAARIEELGAQLKMVLEREAETQVRHDSKIDALEAKLAKAVAALRFYADETHYDTVYEPLPCEYCTDIYEPINKDRGSSARAVLAELEKTE